MRFLRGMPGDMAALVFVIIAAVLVMLWLTPYVSGAAPAADYHAPDWFVNMSPGTCQDAQVGGPMLHGTAVQVLVYPVGSSQPVYAHVFFGVGSTFLATVHLATAMQRWYVVELTYEGAPWLMYSAEADCFAGPLKQGP